MKVEDSHLSDQQLLLDIETELTTHDEKLVHGHLETCWKCRTRRQELESAIADFVRAQQQEFDSKIPPAAGPRALLKAQLAQLSVSDPNGGRGLDRRFAWALAGTICGLVALISFAVHPSQTSKQTPI